MKSSNKKKTCRNCGRLVCRKRKAKRYLCLTCRGKGRRGKGVLRKLHPARLGKVWV